jgi:hypothetical protein
MIISVEAEDSDSWADDIAHCYAIERFELSMYVKVHDYRGVCTTLVVAFRCCYDLMIPLWWFIYKLQTLMM